MGKRYAQSPIGEAICEFRFSPESEWDLAVLGLVYEKVKDKYPKRQQAREVTLSLQADAQVFRPQVEAIDRMQFVAEDGKTLIQVGPHLLVVNRLAPYPGWEGFEPLIREALEAYCDVAKPKGILRVGLRYINRIKFDEIPLVLENYFYFYANVPPERFGDHGPFVVSVHFAFEDGRDYLRMELAADLSQQEFGHLILDLDYFLNTPSSVSVESVFEWVNIAHDRIEAAFENAITDLFREKIGEVKA